MELSGSRTKKFHILSQKKAFLIFREMELSYISGKEILKKLLIFLEVTFQAEKTKNKNKNNKKTLIKF